MVKAPVLGMKHPVLSPGSDDAMKKKLLLGLGLLAFGNLHAQVAGYTFRHETGQLSEVTTYPGAVITNHAVTNDFVTPEKVDIPFTFKFGNQVMDSIRIHENGYLWFGNIDAWNLSTKWPISSQHTSAVKGVISALGIDLEPVAGTTTVKSAVTGTAPFRMFIIEWLHTSRKDAKTDPAGPDDISFQVKLYETEERIEVVFGQVMLNPNITSNAELGLKGATYSDFNNRTLAPDKGWNNTVAGNAQTDRLRLDGDIRPSSGSLMVWMPGSANGVPVHNRNAAIRLFPVPACNELWVRDDLQLFEKATYEITDLGGRRVQTGSLSGRHIALNNLAAGVYTLVLRSGANEARQLFSKAN